MRGVVFRLLLVFGSLAISAVIAEVAWRTFWVTGLGPLNNPVYAVYDPVLGWDHIPGARARHRATDFDVGVEINRLGLRDRERTPLPAKGVTRVLAIGDSLTFGFGVEARDAFPAQLDARIAEAEVVNAGVCGYGTDQALLFLEQRGFALGPRVVLVTLCDNDLEENLRDEMYGRAKPRLRVNGDDVTRPTEPVPFPWLVRHSHLWRSIDKHLWNWRRRVPEGEEMRAGREVMRTLLREMARRCAAHDIELVVCQTILGMPLPDRTDGYHTIDLSAAMDGRDDLRFESDPHWNAAGHEFVADRLDIFLRERNLLRSPRSTP